MWIGYMSWHHTDIRELPGNFFVNLNGIALKAVHVLRKELKLI